ncbi:HTH domain-containing protein [Natronococcus sp.]|uniref:HTH domain-containing protein n=1 Tax=Natronococcus sp. TaxID=35747 RepID=UPI003A4D9181
MSAGKRTAVPTATTDLEEGLRVDCYVRPTVSTAANGAIDRVVERLERLEDDGTVDDYRIVRWPPNGVAGDGRESARGEIVAAFERWAERRDRSLEPAFRRRELPASPLCPGSDPGERVRVPIVTLALYEGENGGESDETATVRGVVPHTDRTGDTDRTYTVEEWLSAAEGTGIAVDDPTDERGRSGQATLLEGRQ